MTTVTLSFKSTISRLAGNQYGRQVYEEQVSSYFKPNQPLVIVFPDQIIDVATSFVQGFFKAMIDVYGKENFFSNIEIVACERVKQRIEDNL